MNHSQTIKWEWGEYMLTNKEIGKLEKLINEAKNGDQHAINNLNIFFKQVEEFEIINKQKGDC